MFKVSRWGRHLAILDRLSSVSEQLATDKFLSVIKPVAKCFMPESVMLLQNETSSLSSLAATASLASRKSFVLARNPTPMSLTLSQEQRLRSFRLDDLASDLRPVSVMLTQKLRLSFSSLVSPELIYLSDLSVSF